MDEYLHHVLRDVEVACRNAVLFEHARDKVALTDSQLLLGGVPRQLDHLQSVQQGDRDELRAIGSGQEDHWGETEVGKGGR